MPVFFGGNGALGLIPALPDAILQHGFHPGQAGFEVDSQERDAGNVDNKVGLATKEFDPAKSYTILSLRSILCASEGKG